MTINNSGQLTEDVITLKDLSEGDHFRFVYETKERYLMQKGKIEGCCPVVGQIGSSDEVYHLGAKVIRIEQ